MKLSPWDAAETERQRRVRWFNLLCCTAPTEVTVTVECVCKAPVERGEWFPEGLERRVVSRQGRVLKLVIGGRCGCIWGGEQTGNLKRLLRELSRYNVRCVSVITYAVPCIVQGPIDRFIGDELYMFGDNVEYAFSREDSSLLCNVPMMRVCLDKRNSGMVKLHIDSLRLRCDFASLCMDNLVELRVSVSTFDREWGVCTEELVGWLASGRVPRLRVLAVDSPCFVASTPWVGLIKVNTTLERLHIWSSRMCLARRLEVVEAVCSTPTSRISWLDMDYRFGDSSFLYYESVRFYCAVLDRVWSLGRPLKALLEVFVHIGDAVPLPIGHYPLQWLLGPVHRELRCLKVGASPYARYRDGFGYMYCLLALCDRVTPLIPREVVLCIRGMLYSPTDIDAMFGFMKGMLQVYDAHEKELVASALCSQEQQ